MQLEHAEHTLETIRTLMERSQRYEHVSGYSGLVAGSAAILGAPFSVSSHCRLLPEPTSRWFWSSVFVSPSRAICS